MKSANDLFNEDKYNKYKTRAIVYSVFLVLALIICTYLAFHVVKKIEIKPINYTDTGTVDYRVYLKKNEFYPETFLTKNKSYPTSLIDYIDINYNYVFNIEDITDINFEYKVVGELIIENNTNKKELLKNYYDVISTKTKELNGINEIAINERFQINYDEYNLFANKYRSSLGVDTNSYLKLYLSIKKTSPDSSNYDINETSNINEVIIPLSEKAIEINIDSVNNKSIKQVVFKQTTKVNYVNIGIISVLAILSLLFIKIIIQSIIKMNKRRSLYDKYVGKLLKEYDRLIVETSNLLDLKKYNVIKVKEFTELLDVRDNLKIPIIYYCCVKHLEGLFYVKSGNDIYALFLSSEILENQD